MAQKYLDMMEQEKARPFRDFEEEWVDLGKQLCLNAFEPGNSPKDDGEEIESPSLKRKLSQAEDSYILNKRRTKLQKLSVTEGEDVILTKLRKEDPQKYKKLEKRIRGDGTPNCLGTSVGFKTTTTIPVYSSQSPECSTSQGFKTTTTIPVYSSQSPECTISQGFKTTITIPVYSSQSPEYNTSTPESPQPSEYSESRGLTTTTTTIKYPPPQSPECSTSQGFRTAATTITNPPPQSPECSSSQGFNGAFLQRLAGGAFPLQGELNALSEVVDSMRVDLLQTSMLIDYVKDYLKNYKF
ncbi:uncharacterized protein LOC134267084 [Saccostrea cucullata]|uniref:uncharacterized protein LOC134267084 n=1 Tax=Saccostrea cuccullata TaxID=36930 RepID=UPI002ED22143